MIDDLEIIDFVDYYLRNPLDFTYVWETDVIVYDNQLEQRRAAKPRARNKWVLSWNRMLEPERDRLLAMHRRTRGRYRSFLLLDRYDQDFQQIMGIGVGSFEVHTSSSSLDRFSIPPGDGDQTTVFTAGVRFYVDAGANIGTWTVLSSSFSDRTYILVVEDVPSTSGDGVIFFPDFTVTMTGDRVGQTFDKLLLFPATGSAVLIDNVAQELSVDYTVSANTITFLPGSIPISGEVVSSLFTFYFPVRFVSDELMLTKSSPFLYEPPPIEIVEVWQSA